MTIDAHALVTIVRQGPGFEQIIGAIADDDCPRVCATALAEATIVSAATGSNLPEVEVQLVVDRLNLTIMPFTKSDWRKARDAYEKQVKASDARRPSLGYCLSAAVAARTGAPLIDV